MSRNDLCKCIELVLNHGYQIDNEAFNLLSFLSKTYNPLELIDKTIDWMKESKEGGFIISREVLEKVYEKRSMSDEASTSLLDTDRLSFKPHAIEIKSRIEILMDATDKIETSGTLRDYIHYFKNRFNKLRKILVSRVDVKNVIPISKIENLPPKSRFKLIGMVTEKRERNRLLFLTIEDTSKAVKLMIRGDSGMDLIKKARSLMLDQVVCIGVIKINDRNLKVEEIICPDIPNRKAQKSVIEVYAALISDLHVGSRRFMGEEFNRFLLWLMGEYGDDSMRDIADKTKYLLIAGDLIDGVGVYPNQEEDLEISDVYEQYNVVASLLSKVPEYVKIIVIPGNHDAVRKALPQPAISKDYAESIYKLNNLHSFGNPSLVRLHNVDILLYHGRSLDDVISSVPNLSFHNPDLAMRLLLQARHLAPIYGGKTPIAPVEEDSLVIDKVPDVFHAGHVHVSNHSSYRGTIIVNSGAWQLQTEYQKMMGLSPTPGIATILNLHTLQPITLDFNG